MNAKRIDDRGAFVFDCGNRALLVSHQEGSDEVERQCGANRSASGLAIGSFLAGDPAFAVEQVAREDHLVIIQAADATRGAGRAIDTRRWSIGNELAGYERGDVGQEVGASDESERRPVECGVLLLQGALSPAQDRSRLKRGEIRNLASTQEALAKRSGLQVLDAGLQASDPVPHPGSGLLNLGFGPGAE